MFSWLSPSFPAMIIPAELTTFPRRFSPGARICMSMTDFHKETWNPMWTCAAILTGLVSFMSDVSTLSTGCVRADDKARRQFAQSSVKHNQQQRYISHFSAAALTEGRNRYERDCRMAGWNSSPGSAKGEQKEGNCVRRIEAGEDEQLVKRVMIVCFVALAACVAWMML